ncbi:LysM peptidoglycan-binding domain-containing protein [Lacihabitans sp. LS3-19]|uniref:M23 family metallopeptidase n=1 Tax=Lacihabitans sp. LS3-19 TaxID=2487335 RepID=UPI0020CDFE7C|nr:M23 family metallopeptidase [Lacihabitans sp. LS3-19]MCP9767644.1 LysM peptidoglycan-binding domain-containing protein [Lacihabitans sp. LS3-19]
MKFSIYTLLIGILVNISVFAQKEKGKILNAPKIPKNSRTNTPAKDTPEKKDEDFDFIFEEEPKLRFTNQYENTKSTKPTNQSYANLQTGELIRIEPLRELNQIVNEDTSSIDEGELLIVEIEEDAQFQGADNMVGIASYFSVWDTKSIDPYGINPKEFDEMVPLTLYNISEGRNWAPVLDKSVLTSHFGWRNRRWHKGTDLDLETGDKVYAAFDGIVRIGGVHSGYGRTVILRHYNGLETLYGHLSKINFEPNTIVKAGEEIARGGNSGRSSGSHLHYETRYEGNQFDPENIYNFKANPMEIRSSEFVLSSKVYDYLRGGSSRPKNFNTEPGQLQSGGEAQTSSEDGEDIEDIEDEEEVPVKIEKKMWYTVRHGDNLTEISRKFHTSVGELCRLNKISAYKKLYVGLKLRVK